MNEAKSLGGPRNIFRIEFRPQQSEGWEPLISVSQVTPGGKASLANLCRGDVILAIGGVTTESMTLSEGQNAILSSTQQLCFKIER